MRVGEFLDLLMACAKEFRNSDEGRAIVEFWNGHTINAALAEAMVRPIQLLCLRRNIAHPEFNQTLSQRLDKTIVGWAPDALTGVRRNSHQSTSVIQETLNQGMADALIVNFCNTAAWELCGADLGMYSSDLA